MLSGNISSLCCLEQQMPKVFNGVVCLPQSRIHLNAERNFLAGKWWARQQHIITLQI